MAASAPTSALYGRGTEFARSINGINSPFFAGLTNNASPFSGRNGVGNPMSSAIPGLNGTSSYNAARGPTLGAYDQTNFQLMLDGQTLEEHRITAKQFNMVRRRVAVGTETMGLSSFNYLNEYDREWLDRYGVCQSWDSGPGREWSFYGVPISTTSEDLRGVPEKTQGFHFRKWARIWDLTASLSIPKRNNESPVSEGDHIYLLGRRHEKVDVMAKVLGKAPGATKNYWAVDPWVSHDRCPPPTQLYNYPGCVGKSFLLGTVDAVFGGPRQDPTLINQSRQGLHPDADNSRYLNTIKSSTDINVHLRLAA